MRTVLPTPAPPNRPILPPLTYGVSRSMTLMPVQNTSVFDSSWSNVGAGAWMPRRSVICSEDSSTSSGLPSVFHTWPSVTSPTGTVIASPVSRTSVPRTRPSVGCIEMARTRLSPMCWATSRVSVRCSTSPSPASKVTSTFSALNNSGICSEGNSTSTTGPVTRATRPTPVIVSGVAVIVSFSSLRLRRPARRHHRRSR